MSELKPRFLELAKLSLVEFAVNHPGTHIVAKMYEKMLDFSEESINTAYEQHGSLVPAIDECICYLFTNGRNGFKKPKWMA